METVRIAELADERGIIEGREFTDALILGPAMLTRSTARRSTTTPSRGRSRRRSTRRRSRTIAGVIGLRNVAFTGCTFRVIGIMAPPEVIARFGGDVLESGS